MRSILIACLLMGALPAAAQGLDRSTELLANAFALTPDTMRGRTLYEQSCAACHGNRAWGQAEAAIPALAGQRELYLLRQLADFAELNRDVPAMHRLQIVVGVAPEQDWRDLSSYLAGLPLNPQPQRGDGRSLDIGSGIYRDACAQCHGDDGEGDDAILSPALAGQHYAYLLLQIRGMASGHRFSNVEFDLSLMLGSLSAADMAAVADYISRLGTSPAAVSNPARP